MPEGKNLASSFSHELASRLAPLYATMGRTSRETETHSRRVAAHAVTLGASVGLTFDELREIYLGAALHDVGKLFVDVGLLHKPGGLTEEERTLIRRHPAAGREYLIEMNFSPVVLASALSHHERWDGAGYPDGLRGEEIPLEARIVAVVDTFDTVVSNRTYDPPRRVRVAVNELKTFAGTQFDPFLAERFACIMGGRSRCDLAEPRS